MVKVHVGGGAPSSSMSTSARITNDIASLINNLPPGLGRVIDHLDIDRRKVPVTFYLEIYDKEDLVAFRGGDDGIKIDGDGDPSQIGGVRFHVTMPVDYPWSPPRVLYVPFQGESSAIQGFRSKYTLQEQADPNTSSGDCGQLGGKKEEGLNKYGDDKNVPQGCPRVTLKLLQTLEKGGWSRAYNLEVVFYSIRLALTRQDIPRHFSISPFIDAELVTKDSQPGNCCIPSSSSSSQHLGLISGTAALQGERLSMEDAVVLCDALGEGAEGLIPCRGKSMALYCVFDGHGGTECSSFAMARIEKVLTEELKALRKDYGEGVLSPRVHTGCSPQQIQRALGTALEKIDRMFNNGCFNRLTTDLKGSVLGNSSAPPPPGDEVRVAAGLGHCEMTAIGLESVGSTAMCLLFDGYNRFYCASLGDCRAVLCRRGKAVNISPKEHKANRADEVARIFLQGGYVSGQRVQGKLAVSRSLGDAALKGFQPGAPNVVSADAEFSWVDLNPKEDDFLILASDGLWDVMSSQDTVDFVKEKLAKYTRKEGHTANEVLNDVSLALAEHAINVRHSADNVSVILVRVLDQSDPELACCRKNSITSMACTLNPGGKQHKLDMGDGSEGFSSGFRAPWHTAQSNKDLTIDQLLKETDISSFGDQSDNPWKTELGRTIRGQTAKF